MEKKFNSGADIMNASVMEITNEFITNYAQYTAADIYKLNDYMDKELHKYINDRGGYIAQYLPKKVADAGWTRVSTKVEVHPPYIIWDRKTRTPRISRDTGDIDMSVLVSKSENMTVDPIGLRLHISADCRDTVEWRRIKEQRANSIIWRYEDFNKECGEEHNRPFMMMPCMECRFGRPDENGIDALRKALDKRTKMENRVIKSVKFNKAVGDVFNEIALKISDIKFKIELLDDVHAAVTRKFNKCSDNIRERALILSVLNNEYADTDIKFVSSDVYGHDMFMTHDGSNAVYMPHHYKNIPDRSDVVDVVKCYIERYEKRTDLITAKGRDITVNEYNNDYDYDNMILCVRYAAEIKKMSEQLTAEYMAEQKETL